MSCQTNEQTTLAQTYPNSVKCKAFRLKLILVLQALLESPWDGLFPSFVNKLGTMERDGVGDRLVGPRFMQTWGHSNWRGDWNFFSRWVFRFNGWQYFSYILLSWFCGFWDSYLPKHVLSKISKLCKSEPLTLSSWNGHMTLPRLFGRQWSRKAFVMHKAQKFGYDGGIGDPRCESSFILVGCVGRSIFFPLVCQRFCGYNLLRRLVP